MGKPKAISLFIDNRKMLRRLSNEQKGEWIDAILAYADGEDVDVDSLSEGAAVAFEVAANQIDRDFEKYYAKCEKNRKAGQKSAQARDDSKRQQTLANVNECQRTLTNANQDEEEDKEENKKEINKEKHGEFKNVLLTKYEAEKIKAKFPKDWQNRIERLSQYLAQTGKRYKSHYATILAWARNDKPPDSKRGSVYSAEGASFDLEAYERKDLFDSG